LGSVVAVLGGLAASIDLCPAGELWFIGWELAQEAGREIRENQQSISSLRNKGIKSARIQAGPFLCAEHV
jgi:hypothetical protein